MVFLPCIHFYVCYNTWQRGQTNLKKDEQSLLYFRMTKVALA